MRNNPHYRRKSKHSPKGWAQYMGAHKPHQKGERARYYSDFEPATRCSEPGCWNSACSGKPKCYEHMDLSGLQGRMEQYERELELLRRGHGSQLDPKTSMLIADITAVLVLQGPKTVERLIIELDLPIEPLHLMELLRHLQDIGLIQIGVTKTGIDVVRLAQRRNPDEDRQAIRRRYLSGETELREQYLWQLRAENRAIYCRICTNQIVNEEAVSLSGQTLCTACFEAILESDEIACMGCESGLVYHDQEMILSRIDENRNIFEGPLWCDDCLASEIHAVEGDAASEAAYDRWYEDTTYGYDPDYQ